VFCSTIEATIFYRHQPEEIRPLSAAMIGLAEHIRAVSSGVERYRIKAICDGDYFREKEARMMRTVLLRAAKHARQNLHDYFPLMREEVIGNAERLEEVVERYWNEFRRLQRESIPAT
jgi:hypothetical protein